MDGSGSALIRTCQQAVQRAHGGDRHGPAQLQRHSAAVGRSASRVAGLHRDVRH